MVKRNAGVVSVVSNDENQNPQGSLNLCLNDVKILIELLPVQETPTAPYSPPLKLPPAAATQPPHMTPPPSVALTPDAEPGASPGWDKHLAGHPRLKMHKVAPGPVGRDQSEAPHPFDEKIYSDTFKAFLKADSPQVNEAVRRISITHNKVKSTEKLMIIPHYAGSNILSRESLPEIKVIDRYKYQPFKLLRIVHCDHKRALKVEGQCHVVLNK